MIDMTKPAQGSMPEAARTPETKQQEMTQTSETAQTKTPEQTARKESKSISDVLNTYINTETLTGKNNLLKKLRATLDMYLNTPDRYLSEIAAVSASINDLKKEIAYMEAEEKREKPPEQKPARVLYDTQSILSTSVVRRKPDNYSYMEIPRHVEKRSEK